MGRVSDDPPGHRVALVCVVALGVALRLVYITEPMRYDESVTYMYFARLPWFEALSTYTYPNNHVLHTLLVKASVAAFGNSPWVLRLPAFLAGSFVIIATHAVARALYGARAALFATAIVATSGILVLYSTNARGYMLVVLAFLLLVLLATRLLNAGRVLHWVAFALVAAAGLWTIPVMLYPLGTVALWLALTAWVDGKRNELPRLGIALAAAGALALLAYWPVIDREGLSALTSNRFVTPSNWPQFLLALPITLGQAIWSWSLGAPTLISVALLGCALLALSRHRAISRFRIGIPVAAFAWCGVLLLANRRAPFPRVWLWLLPIAASLAGVGLLVILDRWQRTRLVIQGRESAFAILLALALASTAVMSSAVPLNRDTGTFRDANEAAAMLASVLQPGDRVVAGIPTNGPLDYYLNRHGVDRSHLSLDERQARRIFVVVDDREGESLSNLTARSEVRDSSRFTAATVAASFEASRVYLYSRR